MDSDSKFTAEERARVIAEANFYTGRGPKPASLEPKPPVRKEAPNTELIYKTHEPVETAAADTSSKWAAYIERQILHALEPLQEAVGEIMSEERVSMRAHVKTAVDRLDHELG